MSKNNKERHARVFISYSHDSPEHADKILEFAKQLREDGIDAILDQYEPWPEKGWPQWMLQQVSEADFVLMICTEMYYKGVMDKLAPGEKRGIKYEWNLINNHFYKAGSVNKRFLPVILEKTCVEWIPDPFQAMPWFCVVTDEGYEDLYRRLTNQPKTKRPKLGKLKSLEVREVKINFFADGGGDGGEGGGDGGREEEKKDIGGRIKVLKLILVSLALITLVVGAFWAIFKGSKEALEVMYWITGSLAAIAIIVGTSFVMKKPKSAVNGKKAEDVKKGKGGNDIPKKRMPIPYLACGILGSVLLLWVVYKTPRLDLKTIVDYQKWKAPCCVKKELMTIDNVRGTLGKKEQQNLNSIIDTNSMYCILVRNEGPSDANHVVLTIPDANYVEIMREGKDPKEVPPSEMITLGNILIEEEICVNAWAKCPASRHNATGVAIFNELGAAPLYVRTPVGAIARWINKYITGMVILIFIGGMLVCICVHWPIRKLFRKSRQIFHRLKGA